jgi:hypothetical protein
MAQTKDALVSADAVDSESFIPNCVAAIARDNADITKDAIFNPSWSSATPFALTLTVLPGLAPRLPVVRLRSMSKLKWVGACNSARRNSGSQLENSMPSTDT